MICMKRRRPARKADKRDKEVKFKNCTPLTGYISEISNTQVDNAMWCDVNVQFNRM